MDWNRHTETWIAGMAIQELWWYRDRGSQQPKQNLDGQTQSEGIIIINYLQNFIQHSLFKVISSQRWNYCQSSVLILT